MQVSYLCYKWFVERQKVTLDVASKNKLVLASLCVNFTCFKKLLFHSIYVKKCAAARNKM